MEVKIFQGGGLFWTSEGRKNVWCSLLDGLENECDWHSLPCRGGKAFPFISIAGSVLWADDRHINRKSTNLLIFNIMCLRDITAKKKKKYPNKVVKFESFSTALVGQTQKGGRPLKGE